MLILICVIFLFISILLFKQILMFSVPPGYPYTICIAEQVLYWIYSLHVIMDSTHLLLGSSLPKKRSLSWPHSSSTKTADGKDLKLGDKKAVPARERLESKFNICQLVKLKVLEICKFKTWKGITES